MPKRKEQRQNLLYTCQWLICIRLRVTGNAQIFSSGHINVDDLEIILNGDAMVKVYCYGNLKVKPAEGYELGH